MSFQQNWNYKNFYTLSYFSLVFKCRLILLPWLQSCFSIGCLLFSNILYFLSPSFSKPLYCSIRSIYYFNCLLNSWSPSSSSSWWHLILFLFFDYLLPFTFYTCLYTSDCSLFSILIMTNSSLVLSEFPLFLLSNKSTVKYTAHTSTYVQMQPLISNLDTHFSLNLR